MRFIARVEDLPEMLAFIRREGGRLGLSSEPLGKIELASEEALVNIILHAKSKDLFIECGVSKGRFEVMIKDQGPAFNPVESHIDPRVDRPIAERHIGGLGIYLMRTLLDESIYQRVGEENILRLRLAL